MSGELLSVTIVDSTPLDVVSSIGIDGSGWVAQVVLAGLTSTVGTLDASKLTISVTDPGYTASSTATVSRTITGVAHLKRQHPNGNSRQISTDGTDLTILVTLDDWIYAGTTIVSAQIASGFYTGSAVSTSPSNTNNSDEPYTKPIGAWTNFQNERATGDTHRVEWCAAHRHARNGRMVARVEMTAFDGTNTGATSTISSTALSTLQTQGNIAEAYPADVDMSNQTQGAITKVNLRAYPWIGDSSAVLDLEVDGYDWPTPKPLTPLRVLCDRTGAYGGAFAYVDGVGAGTPAVSSSAVTARANPYATPQAALTAAIAWNNTNKGHNDSGGVSIRVKDDNGADKTYDLTANMPGTAGLTWGIIEADPLNTGVVTITVSGFRTFAGGLLWRNLRIATNASTSTAIFYETGFGTAGTLFACDECTVDNTNNKKIVSGYDYKFLRNLHLTGGNVLDFDDGLSGSNVICAIGLTQDATASCLRFNCTPHVWIGNDLRGQTINRPPTAKSTGDGFFVYNNRVSIIDTNGDAAATISTGAAVIQNLAEKNPSDAQAASIKSFADGDLTTIKNYVLMHNTGVGERCSQMYNDNASTKTVPAGLIKKGTPKYNIWRNYNGKHDEFDGGVGSVGAISYAYSVGAVGNVSLFGAVQELTTNAPSNDATDQYMGYAWLPSSEYNLYRTALGYSVDDILAMFEDFTAAPAASPAIGGNYRPLASASDLLNRVPSGMSVLQYDISGVPRNAAGLGASGAYELEYAPSTGGRRYNVTAPVSGGVKASLCSYP